MPLGKRLLTSLDGPIQSHSKFNLASIINVISNVALKHRAGGGLGGGVLTQGQSSSSHNAATISKISMKNDIFMVLATFSFNHKNVFPQFSSYSPNNS